MDNLNIKAAKLIENFFTRKEIYIMNPFTMKRIHPKSIDIQYLHNINPAYTKLLNRITRERNEEIAWSPYAVQKYKDYIKRGEPQKLEAELLKLRTLIEAYEADVRND